jgi:hypothetical protein
MCLKEKSHNNTTQLKPPPKESCSDQNSNSATYEAQVVTVTQARLTEIHKSDFLYYTNICSHYTMQLKDSYLHKVAVHANSTCAARHNALTEVIQRPPWEFQLVWRNKLLLPANTVHHSCLNLAHIGNISVQEQGSMNKNGMTVNSPST